MEEKAALRKTIKAHLASLAPETFSQAGAAAAEKLDTSFDWDKIRSVLLFISMKDEIDTRPLMDVILKKQKQIFVPHVEGERIAFYPVNDSFNAPRVESGSSLRAENFPVLVITPGLAFDRRLYRLGRGGGHYDRFYAALDQEDMPYTAMGLCLDCQLVDKVPVCPHDKRMCLLLTEKGVKTPI